MKSKLSTHFNNYLSFVILSLLVLGCKQGTIDLKLNPELNKDYTLNYITNGNINIQLGGTKIDQEVGIQFDAILKFTDFNEDIYNVSYRYKDYKITQLQTKDTSSLLYKMNTTDSLHISDSVSNEQINKFINQLHVEAKVSSKGNVTDLKETSGILSYNADILEEMPEFVKSKIIAGVKSVFENEMSKGILEQYLKIFPEKKVDIGHSWKNEIVTKSILSMKIKNEFELVNVKDSIAEIDIDAKIIPNQKEVMMPGLASMASHPSLSNTSKEKVNDLLNIDNIKINAEFSGRLKGKMFLDINTGLIQRLAFNQKLEGNFEVVFFTLPMSMDMNTIYTIKQ